MLQLLPTLKRYLHNWLWLPDDLDTKCPWQYQSHGIAYDPVFAASDWGHCRIGASLLIFPSASVKLIHNILSDSGQVRLPLYHR